jgi:hypothetical protein
MMLRFRLVIDFARRYFGLGLELELELELELGRYMVLVRGRCLVLVFGSRGMYICSSRVGVYCALFNCTKLLAFIDYPGGKKNASLGTNPSSMAKCLPITIHRWGPRTIQWRRAASHFVRPLIYLSRSRFTLDQAIALLETLVSQELLYLGSHMRYHRPDVDLEGYAEVYCS